MRRPLVPEFRVLFFANLGVIVPFGLLLYFFPGGTSLYWAWSIPEPRSALLIGTIYLAGVLYYITALVRNDWQQVENGLGGLILFSYSTIIGWSYYGETGVVYLFGSRAAVKYRFLWLVFIYVGATGSLHLIWNIADTLNGLMAIPNLIAVLASIPLLLRLQREFFAARKAS